MAITICNSSSVVGAKGDVAAMSFWKSADEFTILWAKNKPVNDQAQLDYIKNLVENVKNRTTAVENGTRSCRSCAGGGDDGGSGECPGGLTDVRRRLNDDREETG